ncbi:uncharacterized mitochondrial protein-like protein [Tanacetum coccineum]
MKNENGIFLASLAYIDDIVITGNNKDEIVKDLNSLKYFLGIEVLENKKGLCLSKRKYCLELLCEYGLVASKPAATPIYILCCSLFVSTYEFTLEVSLYCCIKGVKVFENFTSIQFYNGNSLGLHAYSDADWAKCLVSWESVSVFSVYFCGNLISWKSKKQATLSRSSAEAEYRCMASITCEAVWLINLLNDLNVEGLVPVLLYCGSTSVIQIAANLVFHEKTKHFENDVHLV